MCRRGTDGAPTELCGLAGGGWGVLIAVGLAVLETGAGKAAVRPAVVAREAVLGRPGAAVEGTHSRRSSLSTSVWGVANGGGLISEVTVAVTSSRWVGLTRSRETVTRRLPMSIVMVLSVRSATLNGPS